MCFKDFLLLFLRLELAAHFQQVVGIRYHVLGFLHHGQVNHADFNATRMALYALQFLTLQMGELSVQFVGLADIQFHVRIVIAFNAVAGGLQQGSDVLRDVGKLTFLDGVQRLKVIVHVFQARLTESSDAIH